MQFRSVLLVSALFFSSSYVASAAPQVNYGIIGSLTSDAASIESVATSFVESVASDATSVAAGIFETVTSVGGSLFTVVTSAGGEAFTLASSEATAIAGDITSFFEGKTATQTQTTTAQSTATHSNAASRMAMGGLTTPLYTSGLTVLTGIFLGAWAIL
ncbi:hypothetical protein JB92DRAFT_3143983 [Gautieria morchelliformis]|nr:hypothetical protein JB92DRAFT_3143983 [Gautieria morchelliformis]